MEDKENNKQNPININENKNFEILSDKNRCFIVSFINKIDSLNISAFIKDDYSVDYKYEDNPLYINIKKYNYLGKSNSSEDIVEILSSLILDKRAFIIEQKENIDLIFQFPLKNEEKIRFCLKQKKLNEKEIINLQKLKIEKLEKEIKELKERKENYIYLIKKENKEIEGNEPILDNEIIVKYSILNHDYSIKCDRFIKISQLKKILKDKHLLNTELVLIFCGIEMEDDILLNDFPLEDYKEEKIFIRDSSYKLDSSNQTKIVNENTEVIFYGAKSFKTLKKYINIYFNNNNIFYDLYNENVLYKEFWGKYFEDIRCFNIKTISNFSKIKININHKYTLEVNRFADKYSLMHYLEDKFNYKYNKEIYEPAFFYNQEIEFNSLKELNITGDISVDLYLVPSKQYLDIIMKENKNFQIYIKRLNGKTTTLNVCGCLRIIDLKILNQLKEGIPFVINRLIYDGRQLEDERTLEDYGIKNQSTLHSVLSLRGG